MKKTLLLCGTILACLVMLITTASAEELVTVTKEFDWWDRPASTSEQVVLMQQDTQEAAEYIYQAILSETALIDIEQFDFICNVETEEAPELDAVMFQVYYHHPELFYMKSWRWSYNPFSGLIVALEPVYTITGTERKEAKELYDTELDSILAQIEEDWSDLEKILYINDYLASHYEYDLRVYADANAANYDAYRFFRDDTGVCEAYYFTCKALLDACGIESTYGRSEAANHIWNVVKLNGSWYHLDITWNDPTNDVLGKACHEYFLLSTSKLLAICPDREDWVCGETISCVSTIYDNYYWGEIETPFVPINGKWYYGTDENICVTNDVSKAGTAVIHHDVWRVPGRPNAYWPVAFSGLGSYRNWLIYNTEDAVMGYDPATGRSHTFYTLSDDSQKIFGMEVNGNKVFCELDVHPVCEFNLYPNGACPQNREAEVSLAYLDTLYSKTYGGVTVTEEDGLVTIQGTPDASKPFCVIAAAYTSTGKLCDRQMIWSTDLKSTATKWQLEGKTVKVFMLAKNSFAPVG